MQAGTKFRQWQGPYKDLTAGHEPPVAEEGPTRARGEVSDQGLA